MSRLHHLLSASKTAFFVMLITNGIGLLIVANQDSVNDKLTELENKKTLIYDLMARKQKERKDELSQLNREVGILDKKKIKYDAKMLPLEAELAKQLGIKKNIQDMTVLRRQLNQGELEKANEYIQVTFPKKKEEISKQIGWSDAIQESYNGYTNRIADIKKELKKKAYTVALKEKISALDKKIDSIRLERGTFKLYEFTININDLLMLLPLVVWLVLMNFRIFFSYFYQKLQELANREDQQEAKHDIQVYPWILLFRYQPAATLDKLHYYSLEIPKQIALYSSILLMLLMCVQFFPSIDKKPTITKTNAQKVEKKKEARPIAANKSDDYKLFLFTLLMTVVCAGESYFLRMYYQKYNEFLLNGDDSASQTSELETKPEEG
ncbi:MAG: hypothetical protein AAF518_24375 [Spirochaetota bacterium]